MSKISTFGVRKRVKRIASLFLKSVAARAATFYFGTLIVSAILYRYALSSESFKEPILSIGDAFYFSTVTITTLGYGDIHPISSWAKFIASVESLFGIISVGVFLYGIALSQEHRQNRRHIARYKRLTTRERGVIFSCVREVLRFIRPSIGGLGPKIPRRDAMMFIEFPQPIGIFDVDPTEGYGYLIDAVSEESETGAIEEATRNLDKILVNQRHFDETNVLLSEIDYLSTIDSLLDSLTEFQGTVNEQKFKRAAPDPNRSGEVVRELDEKLKAAARDCYWYLCVLYRELWDLEYRDQLDGTAPRAV